MTTSPVLQHAAVEVPSRLTQTERAYRALKQRILDNQLPAGTQLLETECAALLGMSRTPVREAMIRVANEGLVEVRPRHGMRVVPISPDDMREIYEVLTGLESEAAYLVAARGCSPSDLARLDAAVASMEAAVDRGDRDAWAAADERFHLTLVELTGNRRLVTAVNAHWEQSHRARMTTLHLRELPTRSNADHGALVRAIRAGNKALAREVHHDHRARSGAQLVELLERHRLHSV
ncbi:MAG: GntR family transcriptional regulator [Pseudomonadota bacterium]